MPSLAQWSNLLRVLDTDGVEHRELPTLLRLSRRAVRSRLGAAGRLGWTGESRGMAYLTADGSRVATDWSLLRQSAEERWRNAVSAGRAGRLRDALTNLVAVLPLEHPHYPAGYGVADASITGGPGQDWKPVHRERGDTVSALATAALLSQAIVAFAMAYEEMAPVSLLVSDRVIDRVPTDGCPAQQFGLPDGVSALVRHGYLDQQRTVVRLTDRGRAVRDAYRERLHAVERQWRERFGDEVVTQLRDVLGEIAT